jgi:hypothetical protein
LPEAQFAVYVILLLFFMTNYELKFMANYAIFAVVASFLKAATTQWQ